MPALTDENRVPELVGAPLWLDLQVFRTRNAGGTAAPVGLIHADRIVSVKSTRGRSGARTATAPGALTVTVRDSLTYDGQGTWPDADLSLGDCVRLALTPAGLDGLGIATFADRRDLAPRFTGVVTDLAVDVSARPGRGPLLWALTIAGLPARFNNHPTSPLTLPPDPAIPISDVFWIADGAFHASRDPGLQIAEWWNDDTPPEVGGIWTAKIIARPPAPAVFITLPSAGITMTERLAAMETSVQGVLRDTRDGRPDWLIQENRRTAPAPVVIPADYIVGPGQAGQAIGDLVNRAVVSYGTQNPPDTVAAEDTVSSDRFGVLPDPTDLATKLKFEADAAAVAKDIVGRYAWPQWQAPTITIDVTLALEDGRQDLVRQLLRLEHDDQVQVDTFPPGYPAAPGTFWAVQVEETITADRWRIGLLLVPYALLAPGLRWQEVPAGITWDDVPDSLSWLASVAWRP